MGLARTPLMALILALLGGSVGGFITINITTLVQLHTPQEIRGRVFGLLTTISSAASPIAMGLAGIVADLTGKNIPLIYLVCSAIMTVLMLWVSLNADFRAFLSQPHRDPSLPLPVSAD
jgi:MFS family permease